MKNFLVIFSLVLFSVPAFAGPYEELKKEAEEITKLLVTSDESDLISVDGKIRNGREIQRRYYNAHDFLIKVAKSNLTQLEKGEIIIEVCEAYGKAFVKLTKPFVDVTPRDLSWNVNENIWQNTGKILKNYFTLLGEGIGRDLAGFFTGSAFPWFGADARRSLVIKGIAKDLKKQSKVAIKEIKANPQDAQALDELKTIMQILQDAQASEVTRYGGINRMMVNSYTAIAIWQFWQPWTEFPFARTTGSRRVAGLMWFILIGSQALSRKANSGLSFYKITRKIQNRINNALGNVKADCNATWEGENLPKQKEIDLKDNSSDATPRPRGRKKPS